MICRAPIILLFACSLCSCHKDKGEPGGSPSGKAQQVIDEPVAGTVQGQAVTFAYSTFKPRSQFDQGKAFNDASNITVILHDYDPSACVGPPDDVKSLSASFTIPNPTAPKTFEIALASDVDTCSASVSSYEERDGVADIQELADLGGSIVIESLTNDTLVGRVAFAIDNTKLEGRFVAMRCGGILDGESKPLAALKCREANSGSP